MRARAHPLPLLPKALATFFPSFSFPSPQKIQLTNNRLFFSQMLELCALWCFSPPGLITHPRRPFFSSFPFPFFFSDETVNEVDLQLQLNLFSFWMAPGPPPFFLSSGHTRVEIFFRTPKTSLFFGDDFFFPFLPPENGP